MPYYKRIAVKSQGLTVYHVFDDGLNESPRWYWFSFTSPSSPREELEFDIRDLPNFTEDGDRYTIIREAIEKGFLKFDGETVTITGVAE